jgi:acetylornithine/N-succinyldiaminopimelate aminotransferase
MSDQSALNTDSLMYITDRPPLVMVRGEGSWLWDHTGKRYLDFVQGWAVNCLGHSPKVVVEALERQARQLLNPSPAYYNQPMIDLANLITKHSGLDKVFFANCGAEANEGAIKLARKWGQLNKNGAYEIITMDHSFHGRTMATMSACGKPQFQSFMSPRSLASPKPISTIWTPFAAWLAPRRSASCSNPFKAKPVSSRPPMSSFAISASSLTKPSSC